jgi:hypothetical protein
MHSYVQTKLVCHPGLILLFTGMKMSVRFLEVRSTFVVTFVDVEVRQLVADVWRHERNNCNGARLPPTCSDDGDHHTKKSIVLDITHEGYKDARTDRLSARGGGFSASGGGKGDTY